MPGEDVANLNILQDNPLFHYMISSVNYMGIKTILFSGDVMSPPNLDRLLVLPSGCGEQNLVKTAVNWLVAEYLDATHQLTDFTAVKIKNNIQKGKNNIQGGK